MYQVRIGKWKLDKKLKAPEAAYALRQIRLRRSQGKETRIFIRGRVVSEEKLKRYIDRSKVVPEEDASTPPDVIVSTPPPGDPVPSPLSSSTATSAPNTPSMIMGLPTEGLLTAAHPEAESSAPRKRRRSKPPSNISGPRDAVSIRTSPATWRPSPQLAASPTSTSSPPSTPVAAQESSLGHVLAHIDDYYQEYFDSQRWEPRTKVEHDSNEPLSSRSASPETTQELGSFFELYRQADPAFMVCGVEIACQLFRSGKYAAGCYRLNQAFSHIKTLLLEQVPSLIASLLSAICLLDCLRTEMPMDPERADPLTLFLEFVSEMAMCKLHSHHPITKLFSSLINMRFGHDAVSQLAVRRILEIYRNKAGSRNPYYCRMAHSYAWILIWRRQVGEARIVLEEFLDAIEPLTDANDLHSVASRYLLAQIHLALYDFGQAEQCFLKIVERAQTGGEGDGAHAAAFQAWRMLAIMADLRRAYNERNDFELKALECGEILLGPDHPRIVRMQQENSGMELRSAPERQLRFIELFPPIEHEMTAQAL